MLQEERFLEILNLLNNKKSISVQELMEKFDSSESTIRRDLSQLHTAGKLIKVHGGAVSKESTYISQELNTAEKSSLNMEDKLKISQYAASLIQPYDFVYLDSGTTTGLMIEFIQERTAVFVTNSLAHARRLSKLGFKTYILGGELKSTTEAIVGEEAVAGIEKYNFTKGFFGTNGIHIKRGFTTPDLKEAIVKKTAIQRCKEPFILADNTKFNTISPVTFHEFENAGIITTDIVQKEYEKYKNIVGVD